MGNQKIKVGIIGVGQIGKRHLDTYQGMPQVEIVSIAGRDPERTAKVASDYNVEHWTTDFHQLLALAEIDAVDICLHNNYHRAAAFAAFEAGKHVFCEKPMAGSYQDARAMLARAQESGRMFSVQLMGLFYNETKAALEVIKAGWLGKPYYACSTGFRRRGRPFVDGYGTPSFVQKSQAAGGALFDVGVYHIATMLHLLGNPDVLRISGRTYQETPVDPDRLASSGYDVEEVGVGLAHLEKNITLSIQEAWAMHLDGFGSSYLVGQQGGVRLKPFGVFRSLGDLDLDATADMQAFEFRQHSLRANADAYDGPQQHWIAALQGRVPLLPTAEIALNTQLIMEAIYLSDRLGREVTPGEVMAASQSTALPLE